MAIILRALSNSPYTLVFSRLLLPKVCAQKSAQFASLKDPLPQQTAVKYTSNKAAKLTIAELFGFRQSQKSEGIRWSGLVWATVLLGTLAYFCIFRTEENELDELFKGNFGTNSKTTELVDLKLKLQYCIKNNLPTDVLKKKIEELEKDKGKQNPFKY